MSPLLGYVPAWYATFSGLYLEPCFRGLGKLHGMSSRELMLRKLSRARDWEVRWSQRANKSRGKKSVLHSRGYPVSKVWQCERWREKVAGSSRCLLRIAPISPLLCVSGVVGTWVNTVKIDQEKIRVNKLYITMVEGCCWLLQYPWSLLFVHICVYYGR